MRERQIVIIAAINKHTTTFTQLTNYIVLLRHQIGSTVGLITALKSRILH